VYNQKPHKLPSGWLAAKGFSPYRYVNLIEGMLSQVPGPDLLGDEPKTHEYFLGYWQICTSEPQRSGNIPAWYYVDVYTSLSTWESPTKASPGSPGGRFPAGLICGELLDCVPLTTVTGRYSALSYCAGSARDTTPIMIDGLLFNAFANLEHALSCLSTASVTASKVGTDHLLLWTDQVCINQPDNEEKSHQVAFMREIYGLARQVYVVLSTASTLQHLVKGPPKHLDVMEAAQESNLILPSVSEADGMGFAFTADMKTVDDIELLIDLMQFLLELIWCSWWSRAWVSTLSSPIISTFLNTGVRSSKSSSLQLGYIWCLAHIC
jgi:hypothetical protein